VAATNGIGKAKARRPPLVLDTSAILSGKTPPANEILYAPTSVVDEFQPGGRSRRHLEYLLEAGLRVIDPKPASVVEIEEAASQTGDGSKLSTADVAVLALAKELSACVLTDDYRMQNVAASIKIPFQPLLQEGIKEVLRWAYRCRGCGKQYETAAPECDVCGSEVRQVKAA